MPVRVIVLDYLNKLKKEEGQKPLEEQLRVPNLTQLAGAIGVNRATYSEYVNDKATNISRRMTAGTIRILQRLGHKTRIQDVLQYVEDGDG